MDADFNASISPPSNWTFPLDPAYLASQDELRNLLFTTAQTPASTRRPSPVTENAVRARASISDVVRDIFSNGRRLEYLNNYIDCVAPWLDMFDSHKSFAIKLPLVYQNCPAVLYAILAISARQMELKEGIKNPCDSLELYQEAIRLLKPLLQTRDRDAITVSVILCCMEMMSASGEYWRRHLDGCAALIISFNVNGFSDDVQKAIFWCYARMDLCGALMSDGTHSTLIEPRRWLAPEYSTYESRNLFAQHRSADMHANYAVYLCAIVVHLVADRTKYIELGEDNGCTDQVYRARWKLVWADLQTWLDERPDELLPLQTLEADPFPYILFAHWAAISANQLHHTACILLLESAPPEEKQSYSRTHSITGYAKRICGISQTNRHEGCLNNAIQPLWIAGRCLSHKTEHIALIKLYKMIEQTTGWVTSWRITDLEQTWGYQVRRN